MNAREELALRQVIVDGKPDLADPDVWPDIVALPGRLLPILDLLGAELERARVYGDSTRIKRLLMWSETVTETREALYRLSQMSPLESWRLLHPPRLDPLDGVYDCGNPDCPPTGSDETHRRRWRLPR